MRAASVKPVVTRAREADTTGILCGASSALGLAGAQRGLCVTVTFPACGPWLWIQMERQSLDLSLSGGPVLCRA